MTIDELKTVIGMTEATKLYGKSPARWRVLVKTGRLKGVYNPSRSTGTLTTTKFVEEYLSTEKDLRKSINRI